MNEQEENHVAQIGLGLLGAAVARRWLSQGWKVSGYDPEPDAAAGLKAAGGEVVNSLSELACKARFISMCLPDEIVSRQVLTELLPHLKAPTRAVVIDMTTGAPDVMEQNAAAALAAGVRYLDACVGGSSVEAERGDAILMIGGEPGAIQECQPLFDSLARRSFQLGKAGDGARMKLVTNLVLGLERLVLAEGLSLAQGYGFDLNQTLEILQSGPARSHIMETKGLKMTSGDATPEARLDQHWKDVRLILKEGKQHERCLPLSAMHDKILKLCNLEGWGSLDNSAVARAYFSGKIRISQVLDADFT